MVPTSPRAPEGARSNWPALRRRRAPGVRCPVWQAVPQVQLPFAVWGSVAQAFTHWTGLRTVGCPGRQHECKWCGVQVPRLKVYVGCSALAQGPNLGWRQGRALVELTLGARRCVVPLGRRPWDVQGWRLIIGRVGRSCNSQAWANLAEAKPPLRPDHGPVQAREVLRRLWTEGPDALEIAQVERLLDLAAAIDIEAEDLVEGRP